MLIYPVLGKRRRDNFQNSKSWKCSTLHGMIIVYICDQRYFDVFAILANRKEGTKDILDIYMYPVHYGLEYTVELWDIS